MAIPHPSLCWLIKTRKRSQHHYVDGKYGSHTVPPVDTEWCSTIRESCIPPGLSWREAPLTNLCSTQWRSPLPSIGMEALLPAATQRQPGSHDLMLVSQQAGRTDKTIRHTLLLTTTHSTLPPSQSVTQQLHKMRTEGIHHRERLHVHRQTSTYFHNKISLNNETIQTTLESQNVASYKNLWIP